MNIAFTHSNTQKDITELRHKLTCHLTGKGTLRFEYDIYKTLRERFVKFSNLSPATLSFCLAFLVAFQHFLTIDLSVELMCD